MQNNQRIRNFELLLVISATAEYLMSSLFHDASRFNEMMNTARNAGLSVQTIRNDLAHYEHTYNHNLPVIVAAIFCLLAWYTFHFLLFPKINEGRFEISEIILSLIVLGFVIGGTFILLNTIEIEFKRNGTGQIIGFNDVRHLRKLFVFSDSIAILTFICIYEALAQSYYKLYDNVAAEPNGRIINYMIVFGICAFAFVAAVSQRLVLFLLHDRGFRALLAIMLGIVFTYVLQEFYFRKIARGFYNDSLIDPKFRWLFLIFLLAIAASSFAIWGIMARFKINLSPPFMAVPACLLIGSMQIAQWRKSQQKEKEQLTTIVSNKSAELSSLRSQINPHFLFNALNSLYATALNENSEKTADGIQKLGDMMRFMLHENNHERIPLTSEIAYLHNYIDLQRMRLDETQKIEIRVNIQEPAKEICIAPMLLNPFIENAFKHGISLLHPSWIYITLTLDENHIYFKVHNSLHVQSGNDPEKTNSGIGLENVERRLKLIYLGRYNLQIQKSAQDYFASLTLSY